mmetsp:Transcript_3781/g.9817  ORF Transcript_3781/g.9817 Transcript_3781/m.9817 type:complete len:257 (+) Transcript_3781:1047-1817(+)
MAPTPASVTSVHPPMFRHVSAAAPRCATAHADTSRQPSSVSERRRAQPAVTAVTPASEMRPHPETSRLSRRPQCFASTSSALSEMSHHPRHSVVSWRQPAPSRRTPLFVTSRHPSTLSERRPGVAQARRASASSLTLSHCASESEVSVGCSRAAACTCASAMDEPCSCRLCTHGNRRAICVSTCSIGVTPSASVETQMLSTHGANVRFHSAHTSVAVSRSCSGRKDARCAVASASSSPRLAFFDASKPSSHSIDSC